VTIARAISDRVMRGDRFSWSEVPWLLGDRSLQLALYRKRLSSWIESGNVELEGAAFIALMSKGHIVDGDVDQ
jgi:hypothetical protein